MSCYVHLTYLYFSRASYCLVSHVILQSKHYLNLVDNGNRNDIKHIVHHQWTPNTTVVASHSMQKVQRYRGLLYTQDDTGFETYLGGQEQ